MGQYVYRGMRRIVLMMLLTAERNHCKGGLAARRRRLHPAFLSHSFHVALVSSVGRRATHDHIHQAYRWFTTGFHTSFEPRRRKVDGCALPRCWPVVLLVYALIYAICWIACLHAIMHTYMFYLDRPHEVAAFVVSVECAVKDTGIEGTLQCFQSHLIQQNARSMRRNDSI